jgi:adenine-specific DNA methylase
MANNLNISDELEPVAIEGNLPLKAVGIENLKEANPRVMPPHRYLHPWFARRPTPASRLALLASILPNNLSSDELLRLMQIGPSEEIEGRIEDYVTKKKATEDERSGNLNQHYGYPRLFTQTPTQEEIESLHSILRERWGGDLPTILDPTAGGGVIPFESLRYQLPTKANELNPVPILILWLMLKYAPKVGSINDELDKWGKKIDKRAKNNLREYFPAADSETDIDCYVCTHKITCPTCGSELPLVSKWSLRTRWDANDVFIHPSVTSEGNVEYECIKNEGDQEVDFDHKNGTVSRGGDAECLNCSVVIESSDVREMFKQGEMEFETYAVRYISRTGDYGFRAPREEDLEALNKIEERKSSDYEFSTFLTTPVPEGAKTSEPRAHGVTKWRDIFSPHQLVSYFEYREAFDYYKSQIKSQYEEEVAETILTVLALSMGKVIDRNSRFSPWDTTKGVPSNALGGKHLTLQKSFPVVNMSTEGIGSFQTSLSRIIDSYEEIVDYLPMDGDPAEVFCGDAADMPLENNSIQAAIMDPPYYSSVMYSELSDVFYVLLREFLADVYPPIFESQLTNKDDEAVANPSRFKSVAGSGSSNKKLANQHYETKMSAIFSEVYRVLEPGGVMTVMFTHKETDAWDTLTMSLINSGFTITSTHPITSEMPARIDTQGGGSADSTLLLVGRKPKTERAPEATPSLWNDVRSETREVAKEAARDLIESNLNLTKTDVIISAFGPTLRIFADAYPVVDDEDNEVKPRRALEEAREAVTQVLVDEYLEVEGINNLDDVTEWYILCWLVHEAETFSYDEGRQLGLGIGVDIDDIKRSTKTWRKSRGDISLRGHNGRVQNINEKPENRSSRTPVNPDDLSFGLALDKVHAAMHVYDVQGESACCDWLRERNFNSDSTFKATLKALLQVLPHDHEDWELARDLAVGRTRDVLDLDFSPNVFAEDSQQTQQTGIDDY